MKKLLLCFALLFSTHSFASTLKLKCLVSYNLDDVLSTEVTVRDRQQNIRFGDFEEFQFFVTSRGNSVIELQVLNVNTPMRSYSTARLSRENPGIKLSIWSRESMIDVVCSLMN